MKNIVEILSNKNKTISSMESCTGGMFANEITNVEGSSNVFKLGLVTYSNEFKEYFGVSKDIIEKYSVYSIETAEEMAKNVSKISNSNYSVGITGTLGNVDPYNKADDLNKVFISIYDKEKDKFNNFEIKPIGNDRLQKKEYIVSYIKEKLYGICKWKIRRI